jgi:hypothetical protein
MYIFGVLFGWLGGDSEWTPCCTICGRERAGHEGDHPFLSDGGRQEEMQAEHEADERVGYDDDAW